MAPDPRVTDASPVVIGLRNVITPLSCVDDGESQFRSRNWKTRAPQPKLHASEGGRIRNLADRRFKSESCPQYSRKDSNAPVNALCQSRGGCIQLRDNPHGTGINSGATPLLGPLCGVASLAQLLQANAWRTCPRTRALRGSRPRAESGLCAGFQPPFSVSSFCLHSGGRDCTWGREVLGVPQWRS